MTEPKRLSHGDDLGASLLASARGDQPRAGSRARTAAAIGLGAALGTAAIASAGAAKAAAGASIAPKAIGAGGAGVKVASALWLKLLAAGVVTMAVAGAVAVKVERSSHHADATLAERTRAPVNAATPTPTPVAPMNVPPESPITPPAPEAPTAIATPTLAPTASPTASPIAEPAKSSPRATQPAASSPPESPLAQELRSLDEARSALARGDGSGALTLLDRHDRAFPMGPLRTEAKMLRVEALLARGDRAAAKKLATELLARDPSGPHARRLRTIGDGAP